MEVKHTKLHDPTPTMHQHTKLHDPSSFPYSWQYNTYVEVQKVDLCDLEIGQGQPYTMPVTLKTEQGQSYTITIKLSMRNSNKIWFS